MSDKNLFISTVSQEPDLTLAKQFYTAFEDAGLSPFLYKKDILPGSVWHEDIEQALRAARYMVVLLSERSLMSDMVREEVRRARVLAERDGRELTFIPVRVRLPRDEMFNYEIIGYLHPYQHINWHTEKDTVPVAEAIIQAIRNKGVLSEEEGQEAQETDEADLSGLPLASVPLEIPAGAVKPHSRFYIVRRGEKSFKENILEEGALLRIKAPRQYGKTSLISRIVHYAGKQDYHVVPLSLQSFDENTLQSLDELLEQFTKLVTRKIGLDNHLEEFKQDYLIHKSKLLISSYFSEYILEETEKPVVIAIDEADRLFKYKSVSTEFFSMLRSWNSDASFEPNFMKLRLVLAYSTEAMLAMDDIDQSPFNTGEELILPPFDMEDIETLTHKHNLHFSENKLRTLESLTGGHPYLTRKALYLLAKEDFSFNEFVDKSFSINGPFSDHLAYQKWKLMRRTEMYNALKSVIRMEPIPEEAVYFLSAAGLIKGKNGSYVVSNEIYRRYIKNFMEQ